MYIYTFCLFFLICIYAFFFVPLQPKYDSTMKKMLTFAIMAAITMSALAQTDSTAVQKDSTEGVQFTTIDSAVQPAGLSQHSVFSSPKCCAPKVSYWISARCM